MNLKPNTTPRWLERGSLLLLGATLLGATAIADPNSGSESAEAEDAAIKNSLAVPAPGASSLREALGAGRFWVKLRYRYENVSQDILPGDPELKDGRASTLRTHLGYETADFRGLSGVLEFSDVSNVPAGYDDYNDGSGTPADRAKIPDPTGTTVNQVYMKYTGALKGDIKIGRQRIKLGKDRFIGNVGWRQNEQVYEALTYSSKYDSGVSIYYGYLAGVNDIVFQNKDQDSHLLNVGITWENIGTLLAYGYYLDFPDSDVQSTFTYGARFTGDMNAGDFSMLYGIELAQQDDAGDNPNNVSAAYSHTYLGARIQGVTAKVGFESLDGASDGNTDRSFQTPLSTLHAWNGWADKFLVTPGAGLEDLYFHLGYDNGPFSAAVIYHEFDAERNSGGSYGNELDAILTYQMNDDMQFGLKGADYKADTYATDTQKFWFWMAYSW